MPRGRPKGSKNKSTLAKMNILETPVVETTVEVTDTTDKKDPTPVVKKDLVSKYSYCCDVCEKTFPGSPNPIDFMRLTGKADYYRESRSRKLYVCNDCALELSDVVDRWLLKKNPKLRKFPLNGDTNEENVSDLS